MLVISHRGYRKDHADNTLGAIQAAVDLGVDGVEVDVRTTKDDQLILFHDRYVEQHKVRDLTYDELIQAVGRPVALAAEALERFDGTLWNLEIKTPAAVDETRKLIEQYQDRRRLLVTSFWHNITEMFAAAYEFDCGVLVSHRPFDVIDFDWFHRRRIGVIVWDYEFLDDKTLNESRQAGIMNIAYRIHTKTEHEEASSRAFDGIITDHPHYVIRRADF